MPELPEVEVVRRGIDAHLVGARLDAVSVLDARSVRRHASGALGFERDLAGRRVLGTGRRGKFMWLELGAGAGSGGAGSDALVVHLGMSGQVRVHRDDAAPGRGREAEGPASDGVKHLRIRLDAHHDDGTPVRADFIDQRIFGGMWLSPLAGEVPADAQHIARDVLDPHFDRRQVARRVTASRAAIKRLLLDQGVVSGIGNIYADEALWAARVHGETPGDALSARAVYRVLDEAAAVMRRALDQGGTSFDALYVNVDGRQGHLIIDVELVEERRALDRRDWQCRTAFRYQRVVSQSDLARQSLTKQLDAPVRSIAHRHRTGLRTLGGAVCA